MPLSNRLHTLGKGNDNISKAIYQDSREEQNITPSDEILEKLTEIAPEDLTLRSFYIKRGGARKGK